ncbi:uncharacterized protein LTR77_004842 [Saxophila tyrrhenica]|uniref:Pyrroline-5-carboxylate reductase n=1 Tax=Saxophila tyrrhenica TaxID=1690608 RepID=A0AAV9PAC7_9PEZI|nr:hypothetical protein LTR77_004842 [Saxophila tyrrhenica]
MASPAGAVRVAILGCGSMGTSLLQGFLRKRTTPVSLSLQLAACTRTQQSFDRLRATLGNDSKAIDLGFGNHAKDMAESADVIVLGCRKEDLSAALNTVQPGRSYANKTIVSLMAGFSSAELQQALTESGAPAETAIVRVIPSFAARTCTSVSLLASPAAVSQRRIDIVTQIFEQVGSVLQVDEDLLTKGVAIGSACHALAVTAVDSMTDAGVCEGIPRSTAAALAAQFLRSAAGLMADGMSPEELKSALSTPKGITLNAVAELDRGGTRRAVIDAGRGAVKYAESM